MADKNWRSPGPHDVDLPAHRLPAQKAASAWRIAGAAGLGLLVGVFVGDLRLRTFDERVNASFLAAQREVERLTTENTQVQRKLRDAVRESEERQGSLTTSQNALIRASDEIKKLKSEVARLEREKQGLASELDGIKKKNAPTPSKRQTQQ